MIMQYSMNNVFITHKHKIIKMDKANTLFYHGHIMNNIQRLDKRKDGFIGHRLEFLNEYCSPVRKKIQMIKHDIQHYQKMRDSQYQVIEAEPDIQHLKKQIADYKLTNHYYENKLDQFDRCIAQLQTTLKQRKAHLISKKQQYGLLFLQFGSQASRIREPQKQHRAPFSKNTNQTINSWQNSNSIDESKYKQQYYKDSLRNQKKGSHNKYSLENSRNKSSIYSIMDDRSLQQEQQSNKLPSIDNKITERRQKQYHIHIQQKNLEKHQRNLNRIQKIIDSQQVSHSLSNSCIYNPQSKGEQLQLNQNSLKEVKQMIAQFDHTEALFRECFERKKVSIQKSVSQLQSKLISNKQLFLTACQVIGEKRGKLEFDDFCELTIDQITTLFISFSWLNRKMYKDFSKKRKDLMNILKIVKAFDQSA